MTKLEIINRTARRKRQAVLSIAVLVCFFFGTMILLRNYNSKDRLTYISGELLNWKITTTTGFRQIIDVLTFDIKGNSTQAAIYLSSKNDYKSILDKLEKGKNIKILIDKNGPLTKEGYNLHIYEIIFNSEVLVDYNSIVNQDQKLAIILYSFGLTFASFIFIPMIKARKKINSSS
jgi:hypothetical protein